MKKSRLILYVLWFPLLLGACQENKKSVTGSDFPRFKLLTAEESGVDFVNKIWEDNRLNYFSFPHLYIGGGVAAGDFNNDGFPDLYFTSSLGENRLYLNKGNMQFEDITASAGVGASAGFKTGVTLVDINNDGFLDIYVCRYGWATNEALRKNLLFVNNGDLTFTERAAQYGIDDSNNSIQASFFDYDKDGYLDLFLVNTVSDFRQTTSLVPLDVIHSNPDFKQYKGYDRLFKNQGGERFVDVTKEAGIHADMGFGFALIHADFNQDGWTDIFIGNDFFSPDYLYVNQGDGTFVDQSRDFFRHTSFYSMGADAADISNNGLVDLFVLDMLPENYRRSKVTMEMVDPKFFEKMVEWGYNYQYMHNMLQLNLGGGQFSEIAQLAGVSRTDWSWCALLEDFDNDGWRDIYVSNGVLRDVTERDYMARAKAVANAENRIIQREELLEFIPSEKLPNYAYQNGGDLLFRNVTDDWGLHHPSFSNGAAVADLDGDGDMDIIVNNINSEAFIFENTSTEKGGAYLQFAFKPKDRNRAHNIRIELYDEDHNLFYAHELVPSRGYMSTSELLIHAGMGTRKRAAEVRVLWPDFSMAVYKDIKANQRVVLDYADASERWSPNSSTPGMFKEENHLLEPRFRHLENMFDDFADQKLLPHRLSRMGPCACKGDVNGDGLVDFYVGGAKGQSGMIYLQTASGAFKGMIADDVQRDAGHEDVACLFFDSNGNGRLDLLVVSGGTEEPEGSEYYLDRLYLNSANGDMQKSVGILPDIRSSGSCVVAADIDGDGDLDLFIGGAVVPNKYPFPARSYLLRNDADGRFVDITEDPLKNIGMVRSAVWSDIQGNGYPDLLLTGEWMNLEVFENRSGKLERATAAYGLENTRGWWNALYPVQLKDSGKTTFVAGNLGLNYKFKARPEKPFDIYGSDFDGDGAYDIVLAKKIDSGYVPIRGRSCSSEQMPFIKEKFPTFASFAEADIDDIYGADELGSALHYQATHFESSLLVLEGKKFRMETLPVEAQVLQVRSILSVDYQENEEMALLMAGNNFGAEVETTRADAGKGLFLSRTATGDWRAIQHLQSGFLANKDVRHLLEIPLGESGDRRAIIVVNNDDQLQLFTVQRK